jgi:hypothetical protein
MKQFCRKSHFNWVETETYNICFVAEVSQQNKSTSNCLHFQKLDSSMEKVQEIKLLGAYYTELFREFRFLRVGMGDPRISKIHTFRKLLQAA